MLNDPLPVTKETLRELFIRVCVDSGFLCSLAQAVTIAAGAANVPPFSIVDAFGDVKTMIGIADGTHPAAQAMLAKRTY